MSNFYKPVDIPNLPVLQTQLNTFFAAPEYSSAFVNGGYLRLVNGLPILKEAIPELIPAILSINLILDDITGGSNLTAQSKKRITPIYNISFKYTLEIPLEIPLIDTKQAFINFYESSEPPVMTIGESGIEYPKYNEASCTLLERHKITGAFIMDGSVPRSIESDPADPVHILRFGIPTESEAYVKALFGFI